MNGCTDPTPWKDGCDREHCSEPAGGDHAESCDIERGNRMIDLTRDEITALLEARRVLGEQARAVRPDYHEALDRAVVKLHVEMVHLALETIPLDDPRVREAQVYGGDDRARQVAAATESELRLLDGNR